MLVRFYSYSFIIITVIASCCLFVVKDRANKLDYQLVQIKRQLLNEQNSIQIFKAELAYLRSPERIKALSAQYLQLGNINLKQIIAEVGVDPNMVKQPIKLASSNFVKNASNHQWRFKKMASKYLHTVAEKR